MDTPQIRPTRPELRFLVDLPAADAVAHLRAWCLSAPANDGARLVTAARGSTIVVSTARVWPQGLGDCLIGVVSERAGQSEVTFRRASAFEGLLASHAGRTLAALAVVVAGCLVLRSVLEASRVGLDAAVFALLIACIGIAAVSFLFVLLHASFDASESRDITFALEHLRRFGEKYRVSHGAVDRRSVTDGRPG